MSHHDAELPIEDVLEALSDDSARADAVLDVLSHERRRRVVAVLRDRDDVTDLDDLAAAVLAHEGNDPAESNGGDGERLRIELHHCHLPKLADAGLLKYDYETKMIDRTGALDGERPALDSHPLGSIVSSDD